MTTIVDKLREYEQQGLVYSQAHPTLPLTIWNYSQKVQYEGLWDELTILARGLVTDGSGVVSKGFSKFWNIEEGRHIPTDDFEVFDKADGQYIGCFWYNGEMVVNSRGSFTSPYAIEARRILEEKYPIFEQVVFHSFTYCFELIGFEQIVVSYPEPDLILTGIFGKDGTDFFSDFETVFTFLNVVKKYDGLDYTQIKQLNWKNSEGFVVRFSNGQRCKIKFEDYIQLHRQMTNLSTTAIWEALRDGRPVSEILNDVPDEFYDKVRRLEHDLNWQYNTFKDTRLAQFDLVKMACGRDQSRKRFAEIVKNLKDRSILFTMLDDKDYSKLIWNAIKPKFEKI